jgi:hypothetical protein
VPLATRSERFAAIPPLAVFSSNIQYTTLHPSIYYTTASHPRPGHELARWLGDAGRQLGNSEMLWRDGCQCRPLPLRWCRSLSDRFRCDALLGWLVGCPCSWLPAACPGPGRRPSTASSHRGRSLSCRRAWISLATSARPSGATSIRRAEETEQPIQGTEQPQRTRTLGGDEAVHLAEEQRVLGLEQLHLGDPGGGDDERDVVPRVPAHHVGRRGRPVQPLHLAAWVLDHHGRRLAVAHLFSRRPVARSARSVCNEAGWLWLRASCCCKSSRGKRNRDADAAGAGDLWSGGGVLIWVE